VIELQQTGVLQCNCYIIQRFQLVSTEFKQILFMKSFAHLVNVLCLSLVVHDGYLSPKNYIATYRSFLFAEYYFLSIADCYLTCLHKLHHCHIFQFFQQRVHFMAAEGKMPHILLCTICQFSWHYPP
jgi:hypothetical protein